MASDYCYGRAMHRALDRHRAGTCRVVPILLRPTYWKEAPFGMVIVKEEQLHPYDDHLKLAAQITDQFTYAVEFAEEHAIWTVNTQRRYENDLELFSTYLKDVHIERPAKALFNDAEAWRGMNFGLLKGFKIWLEQSGYATGTIKGCISTVHVFCRLAGPSPMGAGVLDEASLASILTVKGTSGRKARNLDEARKHRQIPTRKGHKKAVPTQLTSVQAVTLKKVTTHPEQPRTREHDMLLTYRDALLMGLFVEHALRCSEMISRSYTNTHESLHRPISLKWDESARSALYWL